MGALLIFFILNLYFVSSDNIRMDAIANLITEFRECDIYLFESLQSIDPLRLDRIKNSSDTFTGR